VVIDVGINSVDDASDKRGKADTSHFYPVIPTLSQVIICWTFAPFTHQYYASKYILGYKLVGDVDYAGCRQAASQITPVSTAPMSSYTLSAWYIISGIWTFRIWSDTCLFAILLPGPRRCRPNDHCHAHEKHCQRMPQSTSCRQGEGLKHWNWRDIILSELVFEAPLRTALSFPRARPSYLVCHSKLWSFPTHESQNFCRKADLIRTY
jgi:hypothetical protein